MNDDPTTINIIINKHFGSVDIIVDLSTGPKTKRIGMLGAQTMDLSKAIGEDWRDWITEYPARFIRQWSNIETLMRNAIRVNRNKEDLVLLGNILAEHNQPPTFNEWEKAKLMQDLQ